MIAEGELVWGWPLCDGEVVYREGAAKRLGYLSALRWHILKRKLCVL